MADLQKTVSDLVEKEQSRQRAEDFFFEGGLRTPCSPRCSPPAQGGLRSPPTPPAAGRAFDLADRATRWLAPLGGMALRARGPLANRVIEPRATSTRGGTAHARPHFRTTMPTVHRFHGGRRTRSRIHRKLHPLSFRGNPVRSERSPHYPVPEGRPRLDQDARQPFCEDRRPCESARTGWPKKRASRASAKALARLRGCAGTPGGGARRRRSPRRGSTRPTLEPRPTRPRFSPGDRAAVGRPHGSDRAEWHDRPSFRHV